MGPKMANRVLQLELCGWQVRMRQVAKLQATLRAKLRQPLLPSPPPRQRRRRPPPCVAQNSDAGAKSRASTCATPSNVGGKRVRARRLMRQTQIELLLSSALHMKPISPLGELKREALNACTSRLSRLRSAPVPAQGAVARPFAPFLSRSAWLARAWAARPLFLARALCLPFSVARVACASAAN